MSTTETIEIITSVRIAYSTPEGREYAISRARRLSLDWSSYGAEYIAAKTSDAPGRLAGESP